MLSQNDFYTFLRREGVSVVDRWLNSCFFFWFSSNLLAIFSSLLSVVFVPPSGALSPGSFSEDITIYEPRQTTIKRLQILNRMCTYIYHCLDRIIQKYMKNLLVAIISKSSTFEVKALDNAMFRHQALPFQPYQNFGLHW